MVAAASLRLLLRVIHVGCRLTRQLVRVDPIVHLVLLVRLEAGGFLVRLPRRHGLGDADARRFTGLGAEAVELWVGLEALVVVVVVVVAAVSLHCWSTLLVL